MASEKKAKANVEPVRQRSQYTCMATSLSMCLKALGIETDEDEVNKVMGARPMKGARWEEAFAAAQHFGARATLVTPCTVQALKEWTDAGTPVMISWNPENRDWAHASVVFDITEENATLMVHVADPNIPNPNETVRVISEDEFYGKWAESWDNYMVRRVAMAVEREITPEGRQVMASAEEKTMDKESRRRGKKPQKVNAPKDPKEKMRIKLTPGKQRNQDAKFLAENRGFGNPGAHKNKGKRNEGPMRKRKHKKNWDREGGAEESRLSVYNPEMGDGLTQPLSTRPDYGSEESFMMDVNDMKNALTQTTESASPEALETAEFQARLANAKTARTNLRWKQMKNPTRWVATSQFKDYSIIEKEAPFGKYYKLQILVRYPEGGSDMFEATTQKKDPKEWMTFAKKNVDNAFEMVKKNNSGIGFRRMASTKNADGAEKLFKKPYESVEKEYAPDKIKDMDEEVEKQTGSKIETDEKNEGKQASDIERLLTAALEVKKLQGKGLYGYNLGTQRTVEATIRKATRRANSIAKALYKKDPRTAAFLGTHAKRTKSAAARILVACMKNLGPKFATTTSKTASARRAVQEINSIIEKKLGPSLTAKDVMTEKRVSMWFGGQKEVSVYDKTNGKTVIEFEGQLYRSAKDVANEIMKQWIAGGPSFATKTAGVSLRAWHEEVDWWIEGLGDRAIKILANLPKTNNAYVDYLQRAANRALDGTGTTHRKASTKTAGLGMYGMNSKTAKLALAACTDVTEMMGQVAYDLHARKASRHERITGFLGAHSKSARCLYAKMLLASYPEAATILTAAEDKTADNCDKMKNPAMVQNCKDMKDGKKPGKSKSKSKKKDDGKMPPELLEKFKAKKKADDEEAEDSKEAKFEKGKPADPTENMTEEQKKKWMEHHGQIGNKKKAATKKLRGKKLRNFINTTYSRLGNRITIDMMSIPKIWDAAESAYESGTDHEDATEKMEKAMSAAIQRAKVASTPTRTRLTDRRKAANSGLPEGSGEEPKSSYPGAEESEENQPDMSQHGYDPGQTKNAKKSDLQMLAAEISKLILQAGEEEGSSSSMPGDDESDAAQPDMKGKGYENGEVEDSVHEDGKHVDKGGYKPGEVKKATVKVVELEHGDLMWLED